LHPISFDKDTQKIFNRLFSNHETVQKLDYWSKLTKILWEKTFGEEFFFPGAMYRGHCLPLKHISAHFDTFDKLCFKYLNCELKDIRFEKKSNSNNNFSYLIEIELSFASSKTIKKVQWRPEIKENSFVSSKSYLTHLKDHENKYKQLNIKVTILNDEKIVSKVLNAFTIKNKLNALEIREYLIDLFTKSNGQLIQIETDEFKLTFKLVLNVIKEPVIYFSMSKKEFTDIRMNHFKDEYEIFDLNRIKFRSNEESAMQVRHKICANIGRSGVLNEMNSFDLEILHIFSKNWSSIRIIRPKEEQVVAMSHLIGLEHLPGLYQLPEDTYIYKENDLSESKLGLILDNRYEKAVLIRNIKDGDYAIIKGKWIGRKGTSVPGTTGHLILNHYLMSTQKTQKIKILKNSIFYIMSENIQVRVSLRTGQMKFKQIKPIVNCLEVESLLACAFSVAVLNVVLQPRMNDNKPGSISWTNMDKYLMLSSIASYDYIGAGKFSSYGLSGFDGCDNGFESTDKNDYIGSVYGKRNE
jgi:hypothetical protein